MFDLALYQPEIPPNTGNIIRLCANSGVNLHLIEPLGFTLDHKHLRRAGLDYRDLTNLQVHANLEDLLAAVQPKRILALTTKGQKFYHQVEYQQGDLFIFGPETRGLPKEFIYSLPPEQRIKIPMLPTSRSLNLANSCSLVVYEAWRQHNFSGAQL